MPSIDPDYAGVTIPPNIAPMNFAVKEDGSRFIVTAASAGSSLTLTIKSRNGKIRFPSGAWRKLAEKSRGDRIIIKIYSKDKENKNYREYEPIEMYVAGEPVDPYLVYRLIYPGYYCWSEMKILQRCIENFREKSIVENRILDMNCINCHAFSSNRDNRFMVHIRGTKGGTYIAADGQITRHDLKTEAMPGNATYPSWHPGGRYIAFSSNQVRQVFYAIPHKSIEVFDLVSDIIVYDLVKNDIITVANSDTTKYLETFPSWSPDGKYLYFCRALQTAEEPWRDPAFMELIKYSIVRVQFDAESGICGKPEMVFDASAGGMSASFPRISPDGNFLVFTLASYGTFPNWHREANLYITDLNTGVTKKMSLNSDETESWHGWSSNGRWLVFSSKRLDGRSTRPFLAYFDPGGNTGKPFVLPQKDPARYATMTGSFNIPELVIGRIKAGPRDFRAASRSKLFKAVARDSAAILPEWERIKAGAKRNPGERPIHE